MSYPVYSGPKLQFRYTRPDRLVVLHELRGSPGWSVRVVGDPDNGCYEWVIERPFSLEASNCGYGDSDIALRDGLVAMHGMPDAKHCRPAIVFGCRELHS